MIAVIVSGQPPLLLSVSGWSAKSSQHTWPKSPESAIEVTSRGAGVLPLTCTWCGLPGSLLVIVSVADAGPNAVGWKRIGRSISSPASTTIGYDTTPGATNWGADEVTALIRRSHGPRLSTTRSRSTKCPRQTSPKCAAVRHHE